MNNPGIYTLLAQQFAVAIAGNPQSSIEDLDGMEAVSLSSIFAYASGAGAATAVVQTSLDGGTTWLDVARFDFAGNANGSKVANISGLTPKAVAAYAALGAEGVNDGILGDRLRAVLTTTGSLVGTIQVRASVR